MTNTLVSLGFLPFPWPFGSRNGGRLENPISLGKADTFIFGLNTGLRLGSQYGATYEMLDLTRNVMDLPRTKNDEAVLSNDHWFKPALKKARINDFKWHNLTRTFASWLVQDGVPLDRVSRLLGHRGLMMTMRYAHLGPNQLHEDVARLVSIGTTVAPEAQAQVAVSANLLQ